MIITKIRYEYKYTFIEKVDGLYELKREDGLIVKCNYFETIKDLGYHIVDDMINGDSIRVVEATNVEGFTKGFFTY